MAILPVTVYGDKILRQKAKTINAVDDNIILTIKNMFETMRNADGVGLAANQVGLDIALVTIDISPVEGYGKYKPIVLINPEVLFDSAETMMMQEGCLSLPNILAEVERPEYVKIRYMDTDEKVHEIEADDLFARVIQHECDHLIGKMIPDRVSDNSRKYLVRDLKKIRNRELNLNYPITEKS